MIWFQLFVSLNTMLAYWLVTSIKYRRVGLWWTIGTETMWTTLFIWMEAYGLIPISLVMFGITVKRLSE